MSDFKVLVTDDTKRELLALAGNSKSFDFPCTTIPKAIDSLLSSEPYSGHDLVSGLIPVLWNAEISKPIRCLLLFLYGKHLNISSQSLMHKNLAGVSLEEIDSDFKYGFSVVTNLRLLKRIYFDLAHGIDVKMDECFKEELSEIVEHIEAFLSSQNIKLNKSEQKLHIEPCLSCSSDKYEVCTYYSFYTGHELTISGVDLSILEQLLRYHTGSMLGRISPSIFEKQKISNAEHSITGCFTRQQLEIIIKQRSSHKLEQWQKLCSQFSTLLS